MSNTLYGSINGPEIPKTVDQNNKKLPLGRQTVVLGKAIVKQSKQGDSDNIAYPVRAVEGGAGSAFLRLNVRTGAFQVGTDIFGEFGGYFDPTFLIEGLTKLKALAKEGDKLAQKELNRANLVLSNIKRLKEWAGLPTSGGFAPADLEGVNVEVVVRYKDTENRTLSLDKDGNEQVYEKNEITGQSEPVDVKLFDLANCQAEVGRILFAPKDANQSE